MKFLLLSLDSGWLDAQIEHNDVIFGICASNNFGGDLPADVMTALYECISEKATVLVGWTNENSDFGLLIEPLSDDMYKISFVSLIYWGELAFSDPEQDAINFREAEDILQGCRVRKGPLKNSPSFAINSFDVLTEKQILEFADSFLSEFTKFFGKKGREYFERHWISGSDHFGDLIDELPYYEYMQLSMLLDQKMKALKDA